MSLFQLLNFLAKNTGMQFVLRRDKQCRLLREREYFCPAGVKLSESKWGGGREENALGVDFFAFHRCRRASFPDLILVIGGFCKGFLME